MSLVVTLGLMVLLAPIGFSIENFSPAQSASPLSGVFVFVTIANLLLAFSLFVVALLAYQRLATRRFLLIGIAFGLFCLRWIVELTMTNMPILPAWSQSLGGILELLAFLVLIIVLFQE